MQVPWMMFVHSLVYVCTQPRLPHDFQIVLIDFSCASVILVSAPMVEWLAYSFTSFCSAVGFSAGHTASGNLSGIIRDWSFLDEAWHAEGLEGEGSNSSALTAPY